jgi:hypothetical protein
MEARFRAAGGETYMTQIQHKRLTRRTFFKLNTLIGGALAVSVLLPGAAVAQALPQDEPPAPSIASVEEIELTPVSLYGTPTDLAASWRGKAWALDAKGVVRTYDRARKTWRTDESAEDFPAGSTLAIARWGRPTGPNRMLMVLGPAFL